MRLALAFVFALLCVECTPAVIPNTDVEDTDFNRQVVEFCEDYRQAVEAKRVGFLLQLADPTYYEDGGNTDATDDLDYAGLKSYLHEKFAKTKSIRYEIRYRRVQKGRKDVVQVDYTYSASYKIPTDVGDIWKHSVADNRLELVPHEQTFRIISGM